MVGLRRPAHRERVGEDERVAGDLAARGAEHGARAEDLVVEPERLAQVAQAPDGEERVELDAREGLVRDLRGEAPVEEAVERLHLRPRGGLGRGERALEPGDGLAQRLDRGLQHLAEEAEEQGRDERAAEHRPAAVRGRHPSLARDKENERGDAERGEDRERQDEVAQERARIEPRLLLREVLLEPAHLRDEAPVLRLVDAGLRHERLEALRDVLPVGVAQLAPPQVQWLVDVFDHGGQSTTRRPSAANFGSRDWTSAGKVG